MCCAYLLLHHGEYNTFYRFRAGNIKGVTLSNKFTVSYGDIQMTTCILTLWNLERDFLLSSMDTVVGLVLRRTVI